MSIGFVGGGQMATALAKGAIAAGICSAEEIIFAEPFRAQREKLTEKIPGAKFVDQASDLAASCEPIFLAVKPHILKEQASVFAECFSEDNLLISIAAGISLKQLQEMLGTKRVIRVMPNTPCQVNAAASAISCPADSSVADQTWVETFMKSVGEVISIPDRLMHAFTGIAGSSPAYIYMVIEALSDGGVARGLPRDVAIRMSAQAVLGAAKMVIETGLHPGALKDQVTSPGGTTIAALRELEAGAVRSAFIEAVATCTERSEDLA
ncbi:MAG: pyrroline-5-carboxylate reductase [Planctomycetota bacterium]|nr:pyrroline-5-carboxylate reductase [Planctomycetota bacterium]